MPSNSRMVPQPDDTHRLQPNDAESPMELVRVFGAMFETGHPPGFPPPVETTIRRAWNPPPTSTFTYDVTL